MSVAGDLTIAQKTQQSALIDATLTVAARIWANLFDEKDTNGSWQRIEPLLVGLIQQRQPISSAVASNFIAALRSALEVPGRYVPTVAPAPTADDIVPWLRAAGPAKAIELLNADRTGIAADVLESINGSITRQVLDGGRGTVSLNVDRDPRCLGYERHASGSCCSFCAMLTGRIYRSAESAGEGRDWHLKCRCGAVPVYSRDQAPPPNTQHYADLWATSTRGLRGADARLAFRQAIEGREITAHP